MHEELSMGEDIYFDLYDSGLLIRTHLVTNCWTLKINHLYPHSAGLWSPRRGKAILSSICSETHHSQEKEQAVVHGIRYLPSQVYFFASKLAPLSMIRSHPSSNIYIFFFLFYS